MVSQTTSPVYYSVLLVSQCPSIQFKGILQQKILAVQNFVGIFQNFLDFLYSNSEKNIIFRTRFSRKILLNDYDFWQFSINPWYMRVYGKLRKLEKNEF